MDIWIVSISWPLGIKLLGPLLDKSLSEYMFSVLLNKYLERSRLPDCMVRYMFNFTKEPDCFPKS